MKPRTALKPDKQNFDYIARELLAGGIAGSVAKTLVAPLDRVKILFQASNPQFLKYAGTWTGVFRAAQDIYIQGGTRGLYQGHSATLLRIFPYAAIKFMAYSRFRLYLMPTRDNETNLRRFLAGSLSGTTAVLFTYPLELIRVRLAYQTRTLPSASPALHRYSLLQAINMIYHEGSTTKSVSSIPHPTPVPSPKQSRIFASLPLLKFYRGFSVTIVGMIPYAGTSFLSWEYIRARMYGTSTKPSRVGNLVVGAASGVLGQTVSYPFEVVRRRMQVGGLTQPDRWMGWRETARTVWKQGGWRGFFIGLSIGYLKIVPMTAFSFAVWEEMKRVLDIE